MKTSDFDYYLPKGRIAQVPVEPRDSSKLMVVDRSEKSIHHRTFTDILDYLREGDVLVFNDSKVIPARLYGKGESGNDIELMLLSRLEDQLWKALVKPGKRLKKGSQFTISTEIGAEMSGFVEKVHPDGTRTVRIFGEENIRTHGEIPLPPYIKDRVSDPNRYQTIYARKDGSIAAPSAGLHFTEPLMSSIKKKGCEIVFVTLHVGWDTFREVRADNPVDHKMHSEYWELSGECASVLSKAKKQGRKIKSVGTTATRLLENASQKRNGNPISAGSGWADIFITPGYKFNMVDQLVTNFHLPKSSLLMLVSALADREFILHAYEEAIRHDYRFYSFGDPLLIL